LIESGPIRVLVVDDSLLVRELLANILNKTPGMTVVGTARDGAEGFEMTQKLKPNVVTMDIEMPNMDGYQAIELIMAYQPTPILVVTGANIRDGKDITFKVLEIGALDLMEKPTHAWGDELKAKEIELVEKISLLSKVKVIRHVKGKVKAKKPKPAPSTHKEELIPVAIASSTGGPNALKTILSDLTDGSHAGIVAVQHMSPGFLRGLTEWLDSNCSMRVKEAKRGDRITPDSVFVAPSGLHMVVEKEGIIRLTDDPPFRGHRPSGNVLLKSVAESFGPLAIGIILTGMGDDGALGIKAIKDHGGRTIAQDEETSVVFGMPKAAIDLGAVDTVLPLDKISNELKKIIY